MRVVTCDDCGVEIKGSLYKPGDGDLGVKSGIQGVALFVPVYDGGSLIRYKEIDVCIECVKTRGQVEHTRKPKAQS